MADVIHSIKLNTMAVILRFKPLKGGYERPYLDVHQNGVRRTQTLNFKFKRKPSNDFERQEKKDLILAAKQIRYEMEKKMLRGEYDFEEIAKKPVDFVRFFEECNSKNGNKEIRVNRATLNKLKLFLGRKSLLCSEVDEKFVLAFVAFLQGNLTGISPYNYAKKFRRVVLQAVKQGHIKTDPFASITLKKGTSQEKDVLTYKEFDTLVHTLCTNGQVYRAFILSFRTGLRFCDVKNMVWKSVKEDSILLVQQKTGFPVSVPINRSTKALLGARKDPNDLVFNLPTHTGCSKILKKWVLRAGINKHVTWHCARHSFATNLNHGKIDILTISKLLGHTSIAYTTRYTRYDSDFGREAIEGMPDVFKRKKVAVKGAE
jgi:site-specific recombinase XerD